MELLLSPYPDVGVDMGIFVTLLKILQKSVFYVMGKVLSGELSCVQTVLVFYHSVILMKGLHDKVVGAPDMKS